MRAGSVVGDGSGWELGRGGHKLQPLRVIQDFYIVRTGTVLGPIAVLVLMSVSGRAIIRARRMRERERQDRSH